ncbi:M23 family metallopeptidase [Dactylosporangium sp. NPDC049525]|uniref:M23 family metallopeptidase n=1 Tax=Dactylosporangium sp. NPDC049525 TaxID=3154730 RepID=UPI0034376FE3
MTNRILSVLLGVVVGLALLCLGGLAVLVGGVAGCGADPGAVPGRYSSEQVHHVQVIVTVGMQRGVPARGQVIAVATAMQESGLRNLGDLGADNDHDSLGLFQQRPSQGWGSPAQLLDPVWAAGRFYDALLRVAGWQALPLTVAAQRVQHSAYPDAYAKWEPAAAALVAATAPALAGQQGAGGDDRSPTGAHSDVGCAAGGWRRPVSGRIVSGFRTAGRATHDGVDIGAGRGTPVHAAADGVVVTARCNAHRLDGSPYSCDVDGDPVTVRGCGWYVDLAHHDGSVTRYCHLLHRPVVEAGQPVVAGQVLGLVGSSGHSSGPHLHLEAHTGRPATARNAVDPIGFFAARGVDLTGSEG